MTAAFLTRLAHVGERDEQDRAHEARESLAAMLAWMTASVVNRTDSASFAATSSAPAESWRGPAGALTQAKAAPAEAAGPPGRVVAEVNTEALGPIRLVVQRTSAGVSVVIGLRQGASLDLAESHRAGLEQALVAAGLSVASVVFTRVAEDGTELAFEGRGPTDTASDGSDAGGAGEARQRSSAKRRLNTVG